jgi:hydrogenase/urease accessory protein HupE
LRVLLALLLGLLASISVAHEVRPAFLQLSETAQGEFDVLWKQPLLGDRRLPLQPILPDGCAPSVNTAPEVSAGALLQRWHVSCMMRSGTLSISGLSKTLTDVLVQINYLDGAKIAVLLKPAETSLDLADPTPQLWSYLTFGIEHLLLGLDHILFIIGLVLFIPSTWSLVKTVTAFTIAHSITLALSVLGWVNLPQRPVEAVIALSIVFLARELMVAKERRSRLTLARPWIMAFAFGLLHGFGFAGALTQIGLPKDQLAGALLLFNLGIEVGQLMVIGAMLAIGFILRRGLRRAWQHPSELWPRWFAFAMGSTAAYWTVNRVLLLF